MGFTGREGARPAGEWEGAVCGRRLVDEKRRAAERGGGNQRGMLAPSLLVGSGHNSQPMSFETEKLKI